MSCHTLFLVEEKRDIKPWYFDIKRYVESKEYPPEASNNDKRRLRRLAASFFLSENILYKRNHEMVLLRCVNAKEVESMLGEVHEGSFGTHANRHAMARKILRAGYYWLTMESDCCLHVRKCHKCQTFADNVNAPPDVSSIGVCRPRIFFLNGFLCFLEDEWQWNGEGRERGDATSRRR